MSVFETATPAYRGQPAPDGNARDAVLKPNVCDRIAGMFRTATPVYQDRPANRVEPAPEPTPLPPAPEPEPPTCGTPHVPQAQFGRGHGA